MALFSSSFDGDFDLDEALSMPLLNPTPIISPLTNNAVAEAALTFPAVATQNDAVCSVCTESFKPPHRGARQIPCGHVYHADCIATWLAVRDSCPLCRMVVVEQISVAPKKSSC